MGGDPDALFDELERLGASSDASEASEPLAERLRDLAHALNSSELRTWLVEPDAKRLGAPRELTHILEDFACELKKLDEGLRVLTAYLTRLRAHRSEASRTLH